MKVSLASIEDGENGFETEGVMRLRPAKTTDTGQTAGQCHGRPTTTADSGSKESCPRGWWRGFTSTIPISRMAGCVFPRADGGRASVGCQAGGRAVRAYTLEPARPVTGIVSDKETGKPLAGVLVLAFPERGGNQAVSVTTDASGRYRTAGARGNPSG